MNVAVYSRKIPNVHRAYVLELIHSLMDMGWTPILEKNLKQQLLKQNESFALVEQFDSHRNFVNGGIDMLISLGGDGTFIECVNYVRRSQVPIFGINFGRLGFLSSVSKESIAQALNKLASGQYDSQPRSLLAVQTASNHFGDTNIALNEVAVSRKDSSAMLTVHATLGQQYMNSYWADGLLVSTPTGSTAYNLACGGPIIDPQCQLHIVTPIAPHNLNVRPIVVPDNLPIKLSIEGRSRNYLLSLDGHSVNIKQKEEVLIRKADFTVNVIQLHGHHFLETVRDKMLWGIDKRN